MPQWKPKAKRLESNTKGSNIKARFEMGKTHMEAKHYEEALQEFEAVLQENPHVPSAHVAIATILYRQGRYEEALERCQEALNIDSNMVPALLMSGNVHKDMGDIDKALDDYEQALVLDPSRSDAMVRVSRIYIEQKRYDEAEKHLRNSLRYNPQMTSARLLLATIYQKQENPQAAFQELENATTFEPDLWAAHFQLGRLYFQQKDFNEAVTEFETAAKLKPDKTMIYFFLGQALVEMQRYADAEAAFIKVNDLIPNDRVKIQLARVYIQQDKYSDAKKVLQELGKGKKKLALVHCLMGDIYMRQGLYSQAVEEYQATLLHDSKLIEKYKELAIIRESKDEDRSKATAFSKMFSEIPMDAFEGQQGERSTKLREFLVRRRSRGIQ